MPPSAESVVRQIADRMLADGVCRLTEAEEHALRKLEATDPEARELLCFGLGTTGRYEEALTLAEQLFHESNSSATAGRVLYLMRHSGRIKEAIEFAANHESLFSESEWADRMCLLHNQLGQTREAVRFGNQSLQLKDAEVSGSEPLRRARRGFDPNQKTSNAIAFSLFGTDQRYLIGARNNVIVSRYLYPSWTVHIYHDDSVPADALATLRTEGAILKRVGGWSAETHGRFWRFLIEDDPEIDFYLVRDVDSVVTVKERVAVEDWLSSEHRFHVMRDSPQHSELMLAGMWGAQRGHLGNMADRIEAFFRERPTTLNDATSDQVFLRQSVWPTVRQDVLTHDSHFDFGNPVRFRSELGLPPWMHIGQNDWIGYQQEDAPAGRAEQTRRDDVS